MSEGHSWRPPTTFDEFRILGPLGSGGMGAVFLAEDLTLRRRVAVKFIQSATDSERLRQRFLTEARAAAQLAHPNLMAVYRFGEVDGHPYIASEYVEGSPLSQLQLPVPWRRALEIAIGLCRGLAAAHEAGVLHRDIKPANAILTGDSTVKLIDFGLAKLFHQEAGDSEPSVTGESTGPDPGSTIDDTVIDERLPSAILGDDTVTDETAAMPSVSAPGTAASRDSHVEPTRAGAIIGTPKYMAVELLYGEPASKQSDVYSLGCLLFELSAAKVPMDTKKLHDTGNPFEVVRLSDHAQVPDGYAAIVERCIAFRPQDRYPSARELLPDLEALAARSRAVRIRRETADGGLAVPGNLSPTNAGYTTAFFGRAREMDRLERSFASGSRLVTLVGTGGTGKTRLARQFAATRAPTLGLTGGVWFADATGARAGVDVATSVARALGVDLGDAQSEEQAAQAVGWALAGRGPALLLLDNLEQVIDDAPPLIQRWLTMSPQLRVLATSRIALDVPEEERFGLPPMAVPDAEEADPDRLQMSEPVQLFIDRAKRAVYGFEVDPAQLILIAAIVRDVDGLPLAIELAAARCSILSVQQIAERLGQRFRLLKGRVEDGDQRHSALDKTIDWSWNLLTEAGKQGLAQCAVFRGRFDLAAAESILETDDDVLDLLQDLTDASLLATQQRPGSEGQTFTLLETIRAYADGKLQGEARRGAEARHAGHYLQAGARLGQVVREKGASTVIDELAKLGDNLIAVAERNLHSDDDGAQHRALQAVIAVAPLLDVRGPQVQLARLLDGVLSKPPQPGNEGLVAAAQLERGRLLQSSNLDRAQTELEQAVAAAGAAGDRWLEHRARAELGLVFRDTGELAEAERAFSSVFDEAERAGHTWLCAYAVGNRGILHLHTGSRDIGVAKCQRAVQLFEECGDLGYSAIFYINLAFGAGTAGRLDDAQQYYQRALELLTSIGDTRMQTIALQNLASVALERDDSDESHALLLQCQALAQRSGDRVLEGVARGELGRVELARGNTDAALDCLGESVTMLAETGEQRSRATFASLLGAVQADLHRFAKAEETFQTARELATALCDPSVDALLEACLAHLDIAHAVRATNQGADGSGHLRSATIRLHAARTPPAGAESDYLRTASDRLATLLAVAESDLAANEG